MQESAYSLMQMARISAKLNQLSQNGLLYIAILTDPTYGGGHRQLRHARRYRLG